MIKRGAIELWVLDLVAKPPEGCVDWPFAMSSNGYGSVRRNGTAMSAHHYVLELAKTVSPLKRDAAHSCHNRRCVNPEHLRWATRAENMSDKATDGTAQRGETHPGRVLTEDDVRRIRAASKVRGAMPTLAERYGVSYSTIYAIHRRRAWQHLT